MFTPSGIPIVEALLALALIVVVPLGLRLGRLPRGAWPVILGSTWLAAAALFVTTPHISAGLVLPWCVTTLWLGAHAARRLLARGLCAEALLDIGQLHLIVAAAWLLASRAGWSWGYSATIVALTSAHFHYAGFTAATVAGVVLRAQKAPISGVLVALGPPLVGLGIALSPTVEVISAVLLAIGMLGLARAMVRLHRWLAIPALPLLGTMALAVLWAAQEFSGVFWLDMGRMARWHGVGNAVGFGLVALTTLQFVGPPEARAPPLLPPFPSLSSTPGPSPIGLYPSLRPFGLHQVPPQVAAYHLDSERVTLLARPTWRWPTLGRWVNRVTGAMGNLVLPHEDRVHRVTNRLSPMADAGWVHSLRSTADGQPMFRLAYGTHDGRMRVVAPLPLGAMDAVLRAEGTEPHRLSSDAIYWVWGPIRVRIPLGERLDGWVADGHFRATQRFTLGGVALLRIDYVIGPDPAPHLLDRPLPDPPANG